MSIPLNLRSDLTFQNRYISFLGHGVLCLFMTFLSTMSKAQVDQQFWMNYSVSVPTSTKWSYGGDVGVRGLVSNYDWSQILIRPAATYRINSTFSAQGAIALFKTLNRKDNNLTEFRIHQDFNVKWPRWDAVSPFFRLRFEQRFMFYDDLPTNLVPRLRLLAGATTEDIDFINERRPIYFQWIIESFINFDGSTVEQFINQARLHFAFGHKVAANVRYEIHYIWQRSRLFVSNGDGASQNVLRIRVFHRLNRKF